MNTANSLTLKCAKNSEPNQLEFINNEFRGCIENILANSEKENTHTQCLKEFTKLLIT